MKPLGRPIQPEERCQQHACRDLEPSRHARAVDDRDLCGRGLPALRALGGHGPERPSIGRLAPRHGVRRGGRAGGGGVLRLERDGRGARPRRRGQRRRPGGRRRHRRPGRPVVP